MINREFWEEARDVWVIKIPPKIIENTSLPKSSPDEIPFDEIDFDAAMNAIFAGEDIPSAPKGDIPTLWEEKAAKEPEPKPQKLSLDTEKFDYLLSQRRIPSYIEACKLLIRCELPDQMNRVFEDLIEHLGLLDETVNKYEDVYQPDMSQFYDYYIPEALELTATYVEYLNAGIGQEILEETEKEVLESLKTLLLAVNTTRDEIYKYATIEIKAKAKALDSIMSQNGFVNAEFKI